MKKIFLLNAALAAALSLGACGHLDTPSMMNPNKPQLSSDTTMEQMPVTQVSGNYLAKIADNYKRFGTDTLQMSLAYDPDSKAYGAMQAFKDLAKYKSALADMGVKSVRAETMKAQGSEPTLMISYDSVTAQGPADCRNMPGLADGLTTREIGDYKFGCSLDDITAKQLYRPTDLAGNDGHDPIDGRRASNKVEIYRRDDVTQDPAPLIRIERTDIQSN